jgi:nitrogen regulatory protein PII
MTIKHFDAASALAPKTHQDRDQSHDVKLVSCILREERYEEVLEAIAAFDAVGGITITAVQGYDPLTRDLGQFRGVSYPLKIIPRVRLDVVVSTDQVNDVVRTIRDTARTGKTGDGKIFVTDVYHMERIRTGEVNLSAL